MNPTSLHKGAGSYSEESKNIYCLLISPMYFHNLRMVHQSSNFMTDSMWQGYKSNNMLGCSLLVVLFVCLFVCLFFFVVCLLSLSLLFLFWFFLLFWQNLWRHRGILMWIGPRFLGCQPTIHCVVVVVGFILGVFLHVVHRCHLSNPPFGFELLRWRRSLPTYHLYFGIYNGCIRQYLGNIGGTTARVPSQGYPKFPFDIKVEKKFMPSI